MADQDLSCAGQERVENSRWRILKGLVGGSFTVRADLHCKYVTRYLNTAYTRLSAVQEQWLKDNPDVPRNRTTLLNQQDAVARRVLPSR
ncbi:hypothetical protein [Streptomyces sp. NPDC002346]